MSRPEEPPHAAASPKRRAGSTQPDDDTAEACGPAVTTPEAQQDVDMLSVSPAPDDEDAPLDSQIIEGVEQGNVPQVEVPESPRDDASTTAQLDNDMDEYSQLLGVEPDTASKEETEVGSEGENNMTSTTNGTDDEFRVGGELGNGLDQASADSGEDKVVGQNDSSTTNSYEGDSDSKTVDTAATSASLDPSGKNASLLATAIETAKNKSKGGRSGRNSPAPSASGPATRGRYSKSDRTLGLTGLSNLGNTCYMNSALQCIRSVEELTKYFLSNEYEEELNYDNPLGHQGQVARAYANLLFSIYKRPAPSSVTPRNFKDTVGRFAPQFSGWSQQDTQEFLGFLLDGLQEDLNRVKKKPYIEKPDSTDDMVNDQEKTREMARKVWGIHKARDDSVIGDLFTGLYKSTLVCPTCSKISITFEPFTNLTLPLPLQNIFVRMVKFFPLNDQPVNIHVEMDKSGSIRALKEFLSTRVGVPADRMIGAEEYQDRFFKVYDDASQASDELRDPKDLVCFYELEAAPTNIHKKKRAYNRFSDSVPPSDDPLYTEMSQQLAVPVMHRINPRSKQASDTFGARSSADISPPHFIMLTPEEAHDEDIIRRKVLEKVATFTSYDLLSMTSSPEATESNDQDPSVISHSDVDSSGGSGGSRIVAKSVEGEEDIVDVSMRDAPLDHNVDVQQPSEKPSMILKDFNKKRPAWIDKNVFLDGQLQGLFDMSFFHEQSLIPTGWTSFGSHNEKLYPRLDTRAPQPASPTDDYMPSPPGSGTASEDSSTEETPEPVPSVEVSTRMVEESSEEDAISNAQELTSRPKLRGGRKGNKGCRTYSKKGQKRAAKEKRQRQMQAARHPYHQRDENFLNDDPAWGSKADGGPLVRLGEGIVVDWNPEAWDIVFGRDGGDDNNKAALSTFVSDRVETLKDTQLEARAQARRMRSNRGICLDDCLAEFEKEEILSEEDKWYCPKCKEFCRAAKKFDLWHTPDILIVHLKRFSSAGHRRDKIDAVVDFPIEGLDISERVLEKEDGKQEIYDLIAIDDHMGGLGGGHYTAFAKNFEDGGWYKFDDSFVSSVKNTANMITSHAYLLFYRRRSDRPLGGPKLEEAYRKYAADNVAPEDDEIANNSEDTESR